MEKFEEFYQDKAKLENLFMNEIEKFALKHKVCIEIKTEVKVDKTFGSDQTNPFAVFVSERSQDTKIY